MHARYFWTMTLLTAVLITGGAVFLLGVLPALSVGVILVGGLILLQKSMDRTVKTARDLSARFGLTVLVTLPCVEQAGDKDNESDRALITNRAMTDPMAEAYLILGASLHGLSGGAARKIIMVTSCLFGEGKSTVAGNLALALSQTGGRVLLVDCNLRRPSLGGMFGQPEAPGLTELLVSGDSPTFRRLDGLPFDLMPGGEVPANPVALLDSRQMRDFLGYARKHHEYVVLDAPPILPMTDARVLAPLADVLLTVVEPGRTEYAMVQQLLETLRMAGKEVDGVILNDRSGFAGKYAKDVRRDTSDPVSIILPLCSSRVWAGCLAGLTLLLVILGSFLWMARHDRKLTAASNAVQAVSPGQPTMNAVQSMSRTSTVHQLLPESPTVSGSRRGTMPSTPTASAGTAKTIGHPAEFHSKQIRTAPLSGLQSALVAIGKLWQRKTHAVGVYTESNIENSFASMGLQGSLLGDDLAALLRLNTPLLLEVKTEGGEKTWVAVVGRQGFNFRVSPPWHQEDWLSEAELSRLWTGWGYLPFSDPLNLISLETHHATPERIRRLQQLLVKANSLQQFEPGVFDRQTAKAIGRLQADKGLRVNGEITPETLILLYQSDPGFTVPRFTLSR